MLHKPIWLPLSPHPKPHPASSSSAETPPSPILQSLPFLSALRTESSSVWHSLLKGRQLAEGHHTHHGKQLETWVSKTLSVKHSGHPLLSAPSAHPCPSSAERLKPRDPPASSPWTWRLSGSCSLAPPTLPSSLIQKTLQTIIISTARAPFPLESVFLIIQDNIEHPRLRQLNLTDPPNPTLPQENLHDWKGLSKPPPSHKVWFCLKITFKAIRNVEVWDQSVWMLFYFRNNLPSTFLMKGTLAGVPWRICLEEKHVLSPDARISLASPTKGLTGHGVFRGALVAPAHSFVFFLFWELPNATENWTMWRKFRIQKF